MSNVINNTAIKASLAPSSEHCTALPQCLTPSNGLFISKLAENLNKVKHYLE